MNDQRLCLFVPSYNAMRFLRGTVTRIPWSALPQGIEYTVLFVDNQSDDGTWEEIATARQELGELGVSSHAIRNPRNLGYGGSVKVAFNYCLDNNIGLIGILHADGQYLPEELPRLVAEQINKKNCALLYGSRLLGQPLAGGMPRYKLLANIILTWLQNLALGSRYSEFHSGYRFYRMSLMREIPFELNSDYFDFDNEIMFQIHYRDAGIAETAIPTFYGEETSLVSPVRTPLAIVKNIVVFLAHRWGLTRIARYS